ncbi:MAG TPA: NAD-dependent deacylase, partial [Aquaticitalea sp.]|nr:NAD-dependent deacylase [Aquaticitalea sp.]
PMIETAIDICGTADILIIIGTSMQVYPAAGLMHYVPDRIPVYYIDKNPAIQSGDNLTVIAELATVGMKKIREYLPS